MSHTPPKKKTKKKQAYPLIQKIQKKFPESQENELIQAIGRKKKRHGRNRLGVGRRTGDSKVESNDSPEIPDMGETSDIPSLPLANCWQATISLQYSLL